MHLNIFLKMFYLGGVPCTALTFQQLDLELSGGSTVVVVFEKAVPRGITRLKAWSTVNLLHYLPYLLQAGIKSKK